MKADVFHAVNCSRVYCRQPEKHGRPWSPAALVGQSVRPTMMNAGADGWSRRRDVPVCGPIGIARRQTMKTPEDEDGEFEVDTLSGPKPVKRSQERCV